MEKLPSENDLKIFTECFVEQSKLPNRQRTISFNELMFLRKKIPKRVFNILMPANFFRAHLIDSSLNKNSRISIDLIIEFVTLRIIFTKNRIIMSRYDINRTGTLNREQFSLYYLKEVMPLVDVLKDLEKTFEICYMNTVESMFFFFLDIKHMGRIRINDVLICGFLENVFSLQTNCEDYENWFSPEKTHQLNSSFQMYDFRQKNYLSKDDLKHIQNNTNGFTTTFIDRLFETHVANGGEKMSYEEFVIFQIAYNHLAHPASIAYFFKILDVDGDGFLTRYEFKYFYTELRQAYNEWYMEGAMPDFDDFFDQFFDMVKPIVNGRIMLRELLDCKQGHNFILCLISFIEFYKYDTRESETGNALDQDSELPLFSEEAIEDEEEKLD